MMRNLKRNVSGESERQRNFVKLGGRQLPKQVPSQLLSPQARHPGPNTVLNRSLQTLGCLLFSTKPQKSQLLQKAQTLMQMHVPSETAAAHDLVLAAKEGSEVPC